MEEMDKFLEKYNFPKLNQEEIENLNRPITSTEIETIIDMITTKQNEKAKIAKDVSAGAVLITAIGAATVGIIIFLPKIAQIF